MTQARDQQIRFTWNLHYACNFCCSYCFFEGKWEEYSKRNIYLSVSQWMEHWFRIYERYGRCCILITGGEPFTYPNFIELIVKLSQIHYPINISSNASKDLESFALSIDPERISLSISFQPEFEKLDNFLRKAKFLRENKIDGCINFVAYPPYIKDIKYYRERFRSIGETLKVIPFWGQYQGIEYPSGYSQEEEELIGIDSSWKKKVRKKGTLCIAGQKTALIFPDGKVARCGQIGEKMLIGNFFSPAFKLLDEPLPCVAEACPCDEGVIWPEEEPNDNASLKQMESNSSGVSVDTAEGTKETLQDINGWGEKENSELSSPVALGTEYNTEMVQYELKAFDSFMSQQRFEEMDLQLFKQRLNRVISYMRQISINKHKDLLLKYADIMRRLSQENAKLNDQEFEMRKINLKSFPKAVFLQFAGPCNSSCVFCSRGHEYEYFELFKFQKKIESKIGYGLSLAEQFILTGSGEFLRLSQWEEILDYFDNNYPHVEKMFSTNGSSLRPEVCEKIVCQESRYLIHVSLHASNAQLHRVITRTDNFYRIIGQVKHLLELRRKGGDVGINFIFVANALNIDDLPNFVRLAANIGVDKIVVYYNFIYVPAQKYLSCFFKPELTNKMFVQSEGIAKDLGIEIQFPPRFGLEEYPNVGICRELWSQIMFNENGHVLPCDASIDCDVRLEDKTYEEVWNSDYYLRVRKELVEQGHTECFQHCHRANPASVNIFPTHVIHRGRKGEKIDLFWGDNF